MAARGSKRIRRVIVESDEEQEENLKNTPPEIRKIAQDSRNARILPKKSAAIYQAAYNTFFEWFLAQPGVDEQTKVSESFLVAYFDKQISAASVWSYHSRLKELLLEHHKIDISKLSSLQNLLKRKAAEHAPKKATTFSLEELTTYLKDFQRTDATFIDKIAVLFSLAGGLRLDELTNLTRNSVVADEQGFLKVFLEDSKTGPRHFFVHPNEEDHFNAPKLWKEYLALMGPNVISERAWLRVQDGKVQNRPIGKNHFADLTKSIAKWLKLPNPDSYTSHSLRRTGATLLAEGGITTEALRQYGGWKNAGTAQMYIESTERNKKRLAEAVLDSSSPTKKITPAPAPALPVVAVPAPALGGAQIILGGTFNNCTIHFHQ